MTVHVSTEKFKEEIMADEFRHFVLRQSSAETYNYDETKKPTYETVNESFHELTIIV